MKRKLLLAATFLLIIVGHLSARQLFLAVDGDDQNNGSMESPWGTLKYSFAQLGAGDTLWVRCGTYMQTERIYAKACGAKDARICVFAYENEKPVFNWSNGPQTLDNDGRGIEHSIGANYWHYRGLEICYCGDNGMKMEGSFCVIESCVFHHNRDSGLQIGFGKGNKGENTRNPDFIYGRYNIVINCDSHDNYDLKPGATSGGGGDADGFAVKLFPGPGTEFHGCRSWMNSDDGWDFYYTTFPIVVHNCWSMKNGYDDGNGNGFKMGGYNDGDTPSYGAHIFMNCVSTDNLKKGFDQNNHGEGCYMLNCIAARNNSNYQFDSTRKGLEEFIGESKWVLRNCVGMLVTERNHKFLSEESCDIGFCSWNLFDNNHTFTDANNRIRTDYTGEYESMVYEDALAERQADGSLPLKFARLKEDSKFRNVGTPITDFFCENYSDNFYSSSVSISYNGSAPDLGAFEYGIPNNIDYEFTYPVNDGSVEDPEPTDPLAEFRDEDGNIAYTENVIANWYPFQDNTLPADLPISLHTGTAETDISINPDYTGSADASHPEYLQSAGAIIMPKNGSYIEFTLPSVRSLQVKLYNTGGRELKFQYGNPNESESNWKTIETKRYEKGNFTIDITSLASDIKRKAPVTVRMFNHKSDGNIQVTDTYISVYERILPTDMKEIHTPEIDMYQTETMLIVYGENTSLKVYDLSGNLVSRSFGMQGVDIAGLSKGVYIVVVQDKAGKTTPVKFMKR
ncbi:MAG: T9SS type A sorting domain-containing protein [Candidatus Azobacteroides sp.]|nr:T9SS type A sorting domain-containing protein [Candidatus Azobacteroides sp.]